MASQNGEIIKNNANLTFFLSKKKHDIQKFRDCIRPNSEKSENKQKICFLLMSANKDSLCSGIQTYFL